MCISLLSHTLYVVVAVFVYTFNDVYIFEYILHDVDVCVYTESEDGTRKLTYIHQCT